MKTFDKIERKDVMLDFSDTFALWRGNVINYKKQVDKQGNATITEQPMAP